MVAWVSDGMWPEWFYNWCNMGTRACISSVICNSVICNKYGVQWCDT